MTSSIGVEILALSQESDAQHTARISREAALWLAENDLPSTLRQQIETHFESVWGTTHPDALAAVIPAITAAHEALMGRPHDKRLLDPIVRRQLRHTLTLDGGPLAGAGDIAWEIAATALNSRRGRPPSSLTHAPARIRANDASGSRQQLGSGGG